MRAVYTTRTSTAATSAGVEAESSVDGSVLDERTCGVCGDTTEGRSLLDSGTESCERLAPRPPGLQGSTHPVATCEHRRASGIICVTNF